MTEMKTLKELATIYNTGKLVCGHIPYIERHISQWRNETIHLVEFGILEGASIRMWRDYFPHATITGIDQHKLFQNINEMNKINIVLGNLDNSLFLQELVDKFNDNPPQIIIDDAGHTTKQQQNLFNTFFPKVHAGGIYIIEDTYTSMWPQFGGRYKDSQNTINYIASLAEDINWKGNKRDARSPHYQESPVGFEGLIEAIHFYDNILVVERGAG